MTGVFESHFFSFFFYREFFVFSERVETFPALALAADSSSLGGTCAIVNYSTSSKHIIRTFFAVDSLWPSTSFSLLLAPLVFEAFMIY